MADNNPDTGRDPLEARLAGLDERLRRLAYHQRILDRHIAALEDSVLFRILRRLGPPLRRLMRSPAESLAAAPPGAWPDRQAAEALPPLEHAPCFGILLAAANPPGARLAETVDSLRAQSYSRWELVVCHDAPAELPAEIATLAGADPRIRLLPAPGIHGPANILNHAAQATAGDYLLVLEPGTQLAPDALHWLAAALPADLIYSDEELLESDGRIQPVFKPGWSPDLLLSCPYLGRSLAVSRAAWQHAGAFRPEHDDHPLYDLALRLADQPATVRHVPRLLFRSPAPPPAAGRAAVQETIRRRKLNAAVEDAQPAPSWQLHWTPQPATRATLVVCSRSPRLLSRCLETLQQRTAWKEREIIVVQHLGARDAELESIVERYRAHRVAYAGPFHFSRMNNLGVRLATGNVLVFLNDDVEPLDASWLERLLGQAERPDVGVAGARLLYPSGSIQHAGVVVGINDGCGHIGRGAFTVPHWPWLDRTRDVSAVTGACLAIRTGLFRQLGGFSESFPVNYNDVDLCLRARQAGYRVVCDAGAVLRHYECQTRRGVVTFEERDRWYRQWGSVIEAGDPFYNPHLTEAGENLAVRILDARSR